MGIVLGMTGITVGGGIPVQEITMAAGTGRAGVRPGQFKIGRVMVE